MTIRKFNKNKKGQFWIVVVSVLVIAFLIIIFSKYYNNLVQINFGGNDFSGSNSINVEGKIEKTEKIGYNEYYLINNKSKILLKNYPKNIDSVIGNNIIANGDISGEGNDQIFIIKSLKDLNSNIIIENNIYTFVDQLLVFDTKEMPSVVPYKQLNKIIMYYKNNPLIDISTFGCSKVSSSRDCKQLIDDFNLNENEYFNSYNGLAYYKIENNRRELFNDILLGYYMETKDDEILLNLSSVIDVINSNYIIYNKKNLIMDSCKELLNIDDVSIVGQEGSIIIVDIKGKNQENTNIECEINFDLMNNWKVVKNN